MFHLYQKTVHPLFAAAALGLLILMMTACSTSTVEPTSGSVLNNLQRISTKTAAAYKFTTLNDNADPTFNQLLGINNHGVIAGYFGSGTKVNGVLHPNKGYTLSRPYGQGDYTNENFPNSVQTQVTAINNNGDTAGFWADNAGDNFGFIKHNGVFTSYQNPHTGVSNGVKVNQLLGINDYGVAVGFYTDGNGNNHAYRLNLKTGQFSLIHMATFSSQAVSAMATAINDNGDIVGTYTNKDGSMHGFLVKGKTTRVFDYTGSMKASGTMFLGINDYDVIVGAYTVGSGNSAQTHGFVLADPLQQPQWLSIDDPNGVGSTTINGLNDNGDLVGFYVDTKGNTDGLLVSKA
jgi:probable HAF family extracellular repeat protein